MIRKPALPIRKNIPAVVVFMFVFTSIIQAQEHQPDLIWQTITTAHFYVHYPKGFESLGNKVASLCEEVYEPVGKTLNYRPGKTNVVIHTRIDATNGFASPLPWRMELYLLSPMNDALGPGEEFLRLLITHEFTHIVELRKVKGLTRLIQPILGDLNVLWQMSSTPNWFIEGFATLNETRLTTGGRGRSPYLSMEMMAPIQEEKPWKLNNANYFSRKRLPSDMMYVSGYYMTEYISKNAGEDVWAKITDKYSSNPFGGFGRYVKSVTGKNMNDWYTDVVNEFKTKSKKSPFLGQVLPSAQANLPNADFSPRWSDENTIIAYHLDFDGLPQLTAINLNGTREKLFECLLMNETSNFSVSKQYIAMGEVNINKKYSATQYADLYLYDRILKTQCQLTFNRRIFSPDISPDETNIAAIQNRADHTTLVIVTITTGEIKFLLDVPAYNILNPRWSPNGREIACIIKDETGQQDVAVVNAETGTFTFPYNHDWYHDNTPCWTPDGKYILYTSDRSGIFNIWAVLTATGERFQVTDVDLGAFMPDVSPDGKNITCNVYSYNGFSAAILPFDTQNWKKESDVSTGTNSLLYPSLQTISQKTVSAKPQIEMESGSYNALRQILIPQGRFPIGQKDEDGYAFGLFGMSEDALHSHSWQGLALINPETGRPIYDILYTYKRWNPRLDARTYNLPEEVSYHQYTGWWRKQGFDAVVSFPQTLESSVYTKLFTPSIGLKTQTVKHSKGILYPKLHNYIGYTAGMQYSRGTQALRDVVPHYAYTIALYADWSHKTFNSDFTAQQISGLANVFLPTPVEHHQLQFLTSYQERRGLFDYDYFGALPVGYSDDHFRKQFRLKTAYHFPIVYVEWELPRVPFYIDYIAGSFFYDWGTSWRTPSLSWRDRKRYSTGIQLTIANIAFRSLPIVFEIRYLYRSSDKKWMSEFSSALQ